MRLPVLLACLFLGPACGPPTRGGPGAVDGSGAAVAEASSASEGSPAVDGALPGAEPPEPGDPARPAELEPEVAAAEHAREPVSLALVEPPLFLEHLRPEPPPDDPPALEPPAVPSPGLERRHSELLRGRELEGSAAAHLDLGQFYYESQLVVPAEAALLEAVARDPELAQAHLYLGDVYLHQGSPGRALWHFERAREGRLPRAWYLQAGLLREEGEAAAAEGLILDGLARWPRDPDLGILLAQLRMDGGLWEEAMYLLRTSLAQLPDHPRANMMLAQALFGLGDEAGAEEARRRHERLSLLFTLRPEVRNAVLDPAAPWPEWRRAALLARLHLEAGRWERAREEVERSLELEPGNVAALLARGQLLAASGDEAGAARHYQEARASQPGSRDLSLALARLHLEAGDPGVRNPERGLRLAGAVSQQARGLDVEALRLQGRAFEQLGRLEDARQSLRLAVNLDPERADLRAEFERLSASLAGDSGDD